MLAEVLPTPRPSTTPEEPVAMSSESGPEPPYTLLPLPVSVAESAPADPPIASPVPLSTRLVPPLPA